MNWEEKYLKYKRKYMELKGGYATNLIIKCKIGGGLPRCNDFDRLKIDEYELINCINSSHDYYNSYPQFIKDFINNELFIIYFIKNSELPHKIFENISDKFKNNINIAEKAIERDIKLIKYFGDTIKNNNVIAGKAITKDIKSLEYIGDTLKMDKTFMLLIAERFNVNEKNAEYYYTNLGKKLKNKEFLLKATEENKKLINIIYKKDNQLFLDMLDENGYLILDCEPEKKNLKLIKRANDSIKRKDMQINQDTQQNKEFKILKDYYNSKFYNPFYHI